MLFEHAKPGVEFGCGDMTGCICRCLWKNAFRLINRCRNASMAKRIFRGGARNIAECVAAINNVELGFRAPIWPIAYGYRLEVRGRVLGSLIRVRTSAGQEWASTAAVCGNAPLGQSRSLHKAARNIIAFVESRGSGSGSANGSGGANGSGSASGIGSASGRASGRASGSGPVWTWPMPMKKCFPSFSKKLLAIGSGFS